MSFPPEFLEEIRLRLPLSGQVGRRVKLTRRGREHSGLCPFHKEKTPSFTVNDDKGFYHCFGCGQHGDVISFLRAVEGLSFPEAVERLAAEAGLEVPEVSREAAERAQRRAGLIEVVEAAAAWFEAQLAGPKGREARDYLASRGLRDETVAEFRLGFAPDERGALAAALKPQGIAIDQLAEAGLVKLPEDRGPDMPPGPTGGQPRDYFFNRIIFPITDRRGRVIAFGGRAMGESKAKYLNSPETPLFHKGRVLYNLAGARQAAHDTGELIVAEGYMDVIALAQAGFRAAVAPLGTAVTEDQIGELWRLVREPLLCLDGDAAGRRAALRAAERTLPVLKPGHSLRFAFLPQGEDPDSFLTQQGAAALRALLDQGIGLASLLWLKETEGKDFGTPERRAGLRQALRKAVEAITDSELREDYRAEMMQRFDAAFRPRGGRGARWQGKAQKSGGSRHPKRFEPTPQGTGQFGLRVPRHGPERLSQRREQLLLALLVHHPGILLEQAEALSTIHLKLPELERLRSALVDFAAQSLSNDSIGLENNESRGLPLDSEGLRCHLSEQGFSRVLDAVLSSEVLIHGRFARPDASTEVAEAGFVHLLSLIRDTQGGGRDEADFRSAVDAGDEEELVRLQTRRKLGQSGESRLAGQDWPEPAGQGDGN